MHRVMKPVPMLRADSQIEFSMKLSMMIAGLLFSGIAFAGPAGVIPYSCLKGDGAYFLMAYDPAPGRNAYAAFGGSARSGETTADTAAREMREETGCSFDTPTEQQLAEAVPSKDHGYTVYVAEVPFISPLVIAESSCGGVQERSDWLWVRWADLHRALETDEASPRVVASLAHKYIDIWDKSASSLRAAMNDGLLPEKGLCPGEI